MENIRINCTRSSTKGEWVLEKTEPIELTSDQRHYCEGYLSVSDCGVVDMKTMFKLGLYGSYSQ
jgi:hypothetical protein